MRLNPALFYRPLRGLPSGVFALWAFKDGSGSTVAENISGLNGTVIGSPTWVSPRGLTGAASSGVNIYSATLNSLWNGSEFAYVVAAKVSGSAMWTDATARQLIQIRVSGNNTTTITRNTGNNSLGYNTTIATVPANTTKTVSGAPTDVLILGMSGSLSGNFLQAYYAGQPEGAGNAYGGVAWSGNLSSTVNTLMCNANTGTNPWTGTMYLALIVNRAWSAAEHAQAYAVIKRWLAADGIAVV